MSSDFLSLFFKKSAQLDSYQRFRTDLTCPHCQQHFYFHRDYKRWCYEAEPVCGCYSVAYLAQGEVIPYNAPYIGKKYGGMRPCHCLDADEAIAEMEGLLEIEMEKVHWPKPSKTL